MWAQVRGSLKFGGRWRPPLKGRLTPGNTFIVHMYYCAKFGFGTGRGPKTFGGRWGPASLGREGRGWTPRNTLLPTCVIITNFVALNQPVSAQVEVSKHFGTQGPRLLGWGRGWPIRNTLLHHLLPRQIWSFWVILGQTIRA